MAKVKQVGLMIIRVGSTVWDADSRIGGATDLPLSEEGVGTCKEAAASTSGTASVLFCGPDEASRQTAEMFSATCGGKVRVCDTLAEMRLGLWEGMRESEFEEKFPSASRQWREQPEGVVAPEGEALLDAESRILKALVRKIDRLKPDTERFALVLRPIAFGIVRAAIEDRPIGDLWEMIRARPAVDLIDLDASKLEVLRARASGNELPNKVVGGLA